MFPKNSRNTRAAKKSHESERVDISRNAPSFAAASFKALRMRAAFPCDTLLPRLFEGRSGSITFMCLMGMRTRGAFSPPRKPGGGSSSGGARPPAPAAPAARSPLAACCRMMDSLPYLSSMRHMNSRVRSSSSASSSAPAPTLAAGSSPVAVPATRSAMRTGPCMLTACVSQSNSANTRKNVCSTSRGVVSDAFLWNLFSTYSTKVSSAYVLISAWCAPSNRPS